MKKFLSELRRRNVFKMAVLFAVGGWAVLSVSDLVLDIFGAPEGSLRIIFFVLVVAFPIALFLSWFYEITPEGLKREVDVQPGESIRSKTGRKMNFMIAFGVLLVVAGMAIQYLIFSESGGLEAIEKNSIAVLPFVDMSPDGDQEYFGDGIAEELLNLLAKIPELKVAARTSSFSFKGQEDDVATIGDKLHVANVLEGSIRKAGNKFRITAQLISAKDGYHLFSETYDRALVDIFAVQDEIAAAVVEQLEITLLHRESPQARRTEPEVLALYLQGRQYARLVTKEGFVQALEALEKAVEIDPDYAPAWAEIGSVYLTRAIQNDKPETFDLARETFEKTLSIDPSLAEAWAGLSVIYSLHEWNFTKADELIQKALSIDGRNAQVLRRAAVLKHFTGKAEEAAALYETALTYDPLSLALHVNLGLSNYYAGNYEQSLEYFDKALAMSPNYGQGKFYRGSASLALGDPETALSYFEDEAMLGRKLMGQSLAYWDMGRKEESTAVLDEFIRDHLSDGWGPFIAMVHAYRGETDQAFELLEQEYESHASMLLTVELQPLLVNLHADPRWDDLMKRIDALMK
jgi:adenylate cyclase